MIIRVRHSAGTWRVQGVDESSTIAELKAKIEAQSKLKPGCARRRHT